MTPLLKTALMPFGTAYAIEPGAARQIRAALRGVDMAAHIRETQALKEAHALRLGLPSGDDDAAPGYEMNGNVAMLSLAGPLTKQVSSFQAMLGGTGTVQFCQDLAAAAADPAAQSIVIAIDSPGGSVDGTEELYQCLRDAAAVKPVYAYASDLCASAAYYAACGASAIYASAASLIGSIGCYTVLEDTSKAAEMAGTEVVVIGDGEMKGAGVDGTPLTAAQKADILRVIQDRNANFVAAVSKGRQMPIGEARTVADGRVHVGAKAEDLGLTDGTMRLSDLLAKVQSDPASLVPDRQLHPNARLGNKNAQKTADNAQRAKDMKSMSKALLAAALAAVGLHSMAGRALTAPEDNPEALMNLMAGDMKAEVDAQVLAHPVLGAALAGGVDTPEKMQALLADRKAWQADRETRREAEEAAAKTALATARDEAGKAAVVAFAPGTPALQEAQETIAALSDVSALAGMTAAYKAVRPDGLTPGKARQTKLEQTQADDQDVERKTKAEEQLANGLNPDKVYDSRRAKPLRR